MPRNKDMFTNRGLPAIGRKGLKRTTLAMIRGSGISKSAGRGVRSKAALAISYFRSYSRRTSSEYRTGRNLSSLGFGSGRMKVTTGARRSIVRTQKQREASRRNLRKARSARRSRKGRGRR
jgi:hypothetical protein